MQQMPHPPSRTEVGPVVWPNYPAPKCRILYSDIAESTETDTPGPIVEVSEIFFI
jgi:hypothetical protein